LTNVCSIRVVDQNCILVTGSVKIKHFQKSNIFKFHFNGLHAQAYTVQSTYNFIHAWHFWRYAMHDCDACHAALQRGPCQLLCMGQACHNQKCKSPMNGLLEGNDNGFNGFLVIQENQL